MRGEIIFHRCSDGTYHPGSSSIYSRSNQHTEPDIEMIMSLEEIAKLNEEWDKLKDGERKCYCGKFVDMTNSDCVDFGLCEEHSDDV